MEKVVVNCLSRSSLSDVAVHQDVFSVCFSFPDEVDILGSGTNSDTDDRSSLSSDSGIGSRSRVNSGDDNGGTSSVTALQQVLPTAVMLAPRQRSTLSSTF